MGIAKDIDGKKYIYTPQIMLHADASSDDIFKALLVLHRVVYELGRYVEGSNMGFDAGQGAGGDSHIVQIVKVSHRYYKESISNIRDRLVAVDWDITRFTFGSIHKRIEILPSAKSA